MNTLRRYETDEAFKEQTKQGLDQLAYPDQPTVAVEPLWNNKTDIGHVSDVHNRHSTLPNECLTTTSGIHHTVRTNDSTPSVRDHSTPVHTDCTFKKTIKNIYKKTKN